MELTNLNTVKNCNNQIKTINKTKFNIIDNLFSRKKLEALILKHFNSEETNIDMEFTMAIASLSDKISYYEEAFAAELYQDGRHYLESEDLKYFTDDRFSVVQDQADFDTDMAKPLIVLLGEDIEVSELMYTEMECNNFGSDEWEHSLKFTEIGLVIYNRIYSIMEKHEERTIAYLARYR